MDADELNGTRAGRGDAADGEAGVELAACGGQIEGDLLDEETEGLPERGEELAVEFNLGSEEPTDYPQFSPALDDPASPPAKVRAWAIIPGRTRIGAL